MGFDRYFSASSMDTHLCLSLIHILCFITVFLQFSQYPAHLLRNLNLLHLPSSLSISPCHFALWRPSRGVALSLRYAGFAMPRLVYPDQFFFGDGRPLAAISRRGSVSSICWSCHATPSISYSCFFFKYFPPHKKDTEVYTCLLYTSIRVCVSSLL